MAISRGFEPPLNRFGGFLHLAALLPLPSKAICVCASSSVSGSGTRIPQTAAVTNRRDPSRGAHAHVTP